MTVTQPTARELIAMLGEARRRTLALIADLDDEQLMGPKMAIVNPLLWEIGHVAWFQEKWSLRHLRGKPPLEVDADALYDSMAIAHDTRWDLPLWRRENTLAYMERVLERVVEGLESSAELSGEEVYFHLLPLYHEDMHDEAFAYTRQTHGWPAPAVELRRRRRPAGCPDHHRQDSGRHAGSRRRIRPFDIGEGARLRASEPGRFFHRPTTDGSTAIGGYRGA